MRAFLSAESEEQVALWADRQALMPGSAFRWSFLLSARRVLEILRMRPVASVGDVLVEGARRTELSDAVTASRRQRKPAGLSPPAFDRILAAMALTESASK